MQMLNRLQTKPGSINFYQAVRLVEQAARQALLSDHGKRPWNNYPLANRTIASFSNDLFTTPAQALIQFRHQARLSHPTMNVVKFEPFKQSVKRQQPTASRLKQFKPPPDDQQWSMTTEFLGLSGAVGVLPYAHTVRLMKLLKQKNATLQHFFNLFEHRTLQLFHQAGIKYHLPLTVEKRLAHQQIRHWLNQAESYTNLKPPLFSLDKPTLALLSLMGLGNQAFVSQSHLGENIIQYAGLFNQRSRNVSSLEAMLRHYCCVAVSVTLFVREQQTLPETVCTRLGSRKQPEGNNARLGQATLLGHRAWTAANKIRINIGPVSTDRLRQFEPHSKTLKALHELISLYLPTEQTYELHLKIRRQDVPKQLQLTSSGAILGWSSWLSAEHRQPSDRDVYTIVLPETSFQQAHQAVSTVT